MKVSRPRRRGIGRRPASTPPVEVEHHPAEHFWSDFAPYAGEFQPHPIVAKIRADFEKRAVDKTA